MDEMKIGGTGRDGCTCAMQLGGCPVHHCHICKEPIGDRPYATSPTGRIHESCVRRGKGTGQLVTDAELPEHLRHIRKAQFE